MKCNARWLFTTIVLGTLAIGSLCAAPQTSPPAADNTKANEANRTEPTAGDAKNNASDSDIMQKIRKAVMNDKSLSTYAHNVKIISQHGQVTLKGPVRSTEEKRVIEERATEVAGSGNVHNQITIKP